MTCYAGYCRGVGRLEGGVKMANGQIVSNLAPVNRLSPGFLVLTLI